MTHRVNDYQLPPGQLWWIVRYIDGEGVSETVFTYEDLTKQTWYHAKQYAETHLQEELGLDNHTNYLVNLYEHSQ